MAASEQGVAPRDTLGTGASLSQRGDVAGKSVRFDPDTTDAVSEVSMAQMRLAEIKRALQKNLKAMEVGQQMRSQKEVEELSKEL